MTPAQTASPAEEVTVTRGRLGDYFQLTKPRLNLLVLVTTFVGYYVATTDALDVGGLVNALLGTAAVAGGASALNMYVERDRDGLMARTATRPLPQGRLTPTDALVFGVALGAAGTVWLAVTANLLTALLGLISLVVYVGIYTPMKVRSTFNTAVGAISGALPPVMGWTAARGTLDLQAAVLFAILFLWQHPHFFALAWMYQRDYDRGGYRMLPTVDPDGLLSARLMVLFSLALVPVSLVLTLTFNAGRIYALGAVVLGALMVVMSLRFTRDRSVPAARKVFRSSLLYLPVLLLLLMLDRP